MKSYTVCNLKLIKSIDKAVTVAAWFETLLGVRVRWQYVGSQQGHCSSPQPGCGPSAGPFNPLKLCEA